MNRIALLLRICFLASLAACWTMVNVLPVATAADDAELTKQAAAAMRKAVQFFRDEVACEGGYLWRYSEDLSLREGEGEAKPTTVWVQPPGTPIVGLALLRAYEATGDQYYLDAAVETAHCLVRGQLRSGGWEYRIEFDPKDRKRYAYRTDLPGEKQRNTTTLDDDNTQSAIRFLMQLDLALKRKDPKIREAVDYALTKLLAAQYPNGAWPQRFDEPVRIGTSPTKRASYPETWSRTFPKEGYYGFYTFNDGAMFDVIELFFEAARLYGDERYREAARRGADFILLSQMPDPQPAWAQQYDLDMQPAWARKFEPPSITGGESQGAIRALLGAFRETGDRKYLEPIPAALAYLRASLLPDGKLARFYELKTNKPLYFTRDYVLTYDDSDMPTHYAFKVSSSLDSIEKLYERYAAGDVPKPTSDGDKPKPPSASNVRSVIEKLDAKGRWLEEGQMKTDPEGKKRQTISTRTFANNLRVLSDYLAQ
ncbi:MAG: pectate lyase [Planctomycetota bacterium]